MALSAFDQRFITSADPYWYERGVFTATLSIPAGQSVPIVSGVSGWNGNFARDVVFLDSIAATQDPNVILTINLDGQVRYVYGDTLSPRLRPVRTHAGVYQNLALSVQNKNTIAATVNTQIMYSVAVWQAPIAYKIMRGFRLTPEEVTIAKAVGLDPSNPEAERGTFPIPLSAVIERTYQNRITRTTLEFAGPDPNAAIQGTPFYSVPALPNELLVLRSIGAEIDADYGPSLTIGRDNEPSHLTIDPSVLSLDEPVELFVPATQSLTFTLSAVTPPVGVTPVRIEVWHIAKTITLDARVQGPQSSFGLAAIQGLLGEAAGTKFYQDLLAGVR